LTEAVPWLIKSARKQPWQRIAAGQSHFSIPRHFARNASERNAVLRKRGKRRKNLKIFFAFGRRM